MTEPNRQSDQLMQCLVKIIQQNKRINNTLLRIDRGISSMRTEVRENGDLINRLHKNIEEMARYRS